MRNAAVTIRLDNLDHNIRVIRRRIGPDVALIASVKADAYGHGAVEVGRQALRSGAAMLGVASVAEAAELRSAGVAAPLLLYGLCLPEERADAVRLEVSAVVVDAETIDGFADAARWTGREARVHLHIDTGMGRLGCRPEEALDLAARIFASPGLLFEGLMTHFPVADGVDRSFTSRQIRRFSDIVDRLDRRGVRPPIIHAANSAAVVQYPEANFNAVRPGILVYGYDPTPRREVPVRPVMGLSAPLTFIKRVPKGTALSYGLTHTVERDTCIGTVAAGYADGYPRLLSNRGRVLIGNRTYPVVGRVCMDQILVDLGPDPEPRRWDPVVLFGPDPSGPDAAEVAELAGTIPYEITCLVSRRVPRTYTGAV